MPFSGFTFIFLIVVTAAFYILPKSTRPYVLLISSAYYVWRLDARSAVWLLVCSLAVYAAGRLIEALRKKDEPARAKTAMVVGVVACVVLLLGLKFAMAAPLPDDILRRLIFPVGFSYYIFQAISYLTDVYKKDAAAEKNAADFLLYMSFFPKFVSGPIERPRAFLTQIKSLQTVKLSDEGRLSIAASNLLYGYFMKTVVADRLAQYTPELLTNSHIYGAPWLLIGILFYTMQLYCDFAGYSAIALGVAHLYGIELTENFHAPYLSPDIATFWRRWHRSLSMWLRDYLYIPLGGSRKGTARKCVNIMIVFLVCGVWHGAGWNFAVWGALHGLYSVIDAIVAKAKKKRGAAGNVLGGIVTFIAVGVAWVFFGAPSAERAVAYFRRLLTAGYGEFPFSAQATQLGVTKTDRLLPLFFLLVLVFDALIARSKKPLGPAMRELKYGWRYLLFYVLIILIFVFGMYGPGYDAANFMYMNF